MGVCARGSKNNPWESALSFYTVVLGDRAEVIRLDGKHPHLLSLLGAHVNRSQRKVFLQDWEYPVSVSYKHHFLISPNTYLFTLCGGGGSMHTP